MVVEVWGESMKWLSYCIILDPKHIMEYPFLSLVNSQVPGSGDFNYPKATCIVVRGPSGMRCYGDEWRSSL
jgi:hypothetical protein